MIAKGRLLTFLRHGWQDDKFELVTFWDPRAIVEILTIQMFHILKLYYINIFLFLFVLFLISWIAHICCALHILPFLLLLTTLNKVIYVIIIIAHSQIFWGQLFDFWLSKKHDPPKDHQLFRDFEYLLLLF